MLPPELLFSVQICTKSFVSWSFAPDPTGGAYSAPPDPVASSGVAVGTHQGRMKGNRKGEGGVGGEEEGGEWKGRRGCSLPPPDLRTVLTPLLTGANVNHHHVLCVQFKTV